MNRIKRAITRILKVNRQEKSRCKPSNHRISARITVAINFSEIERIFSQQILLNRDKNGFFHYLFVMGEENYMLLLHDLQTFKNCSDPETRKHMVTVILDTYFQLGNHNSVELNLDLERIRILRARIIDDQYEMKQTALDFLERAVIDKLLVLYSGFTQSETYKDSTLRAKWRFSKIL
jgi:hypothetical protein